MTLGSQALWPPKDSEHWLDLSECCVLSQRDLPAMMKKQSEPSGKSKRGWEAGHGGWLKPSSAVQKILQRPLSALISSSQASYNGLEQHWKKGDMQTFLKFSPQDHLFVIALLMMRITNLASLFNLLQVHRATPESLHHDEKKKKKERNRPPCPDTELDTSPVVTFWIYEEIQPYWGWKSSPESGWLPSGSPIQNWAWMQNLFQIAQKPLSIFRTFHCISSLTFTNKATISIRKQDFMWTSISFLLAVFLRLELMKPVVILQSGDFWTVFHSHQQCVRVLVSPILINMCYLLYILQPSQMCSQVPHCVLSFI